MRLARRLGRCRGGRRGRRRDRWGVRRRVVDDGRVANAEPVREGKAIEEDRQDDDQGDQEDRHHRRVGAAVAIIVLVYDCHELPPWYLDDNLIDTADIISSPCTSVNFRARKPLSEAGGDVNMWKACAYANSATRFGERARAPGRCPWRP